MSRQHDATACASGCCDSGPVAPWPQLAVQVQPTNGRTCVLLAGELDLATVPQLAQLVERELTAGCRALDLDLSGIVFCDARGLRGLTDAADRVRAAGGDFAVRGPCPPLRRMLAATGPVPGLDLVEPDGT